MCTALVKNLFFQTNSSWNKCKFIFLRKVNDMNFSTEPTLCKEPNQKRRLRSDISLSRYPTSAEIKSIPFFSSLVIFRKSAVISSEELLVLCRSRALDSPRPALNHAICSVYSKDLQTLLKHKYTDNVTDIGFILWNIYFLLVLAVGSKGIINTLKRYYVAFTFAT